jgi:uncharacterized membrane protein
MLTFEQPWLLLLIIPVGVLVYFTWRRMSLPYPVLQRRLILGSRIALFTLIIAALAGAALSIPASRQATVFVGDISDSTATQRAFIEQWVRSAIKHKKPDDQVGIVAFGRNALVEQSVQSQVDFSHFESTPDTNFTDIAAGLCLAAAILPTNAERHIVLLTDGQQNIEDAMQEAQLLQQQGIRLDIVPLPSSNSAEARIDDLTTPQQLHTNENFTLHLKLYSNVAQVATLHIYLDNTLIIQQKVHLTVGEQEVNFTLRAPPPGFHTLKVTLDAPLDTILSNNVASTFVNVQGPPKVLLIEGQPGSGQNIQAALQATKIDVTMGTPNDVPTSLADLAQYSTVILADVPAVALGTARMQMLQTFVHDLGHGLIVSGGQNSYGVGGYSNTPLEQTLPVSMAIPQHKDTPSIAVVLIVESLEAPMPINISKEAAKGVVNMLTPQDQVGISAAYGTLTVPMQHVTNKTAIDNAIDAMNPEDPSSYNPDLQNAEQALLKTNAQIKHVILLGDGDAIDNYAPQVTKMAKENITVSTVATNATDYEQISTMQQIASMGKGRFYEADNPNSIPQILLNETEQAARRTIINETFVPAVVGSQPILQGLGALPSLDGYVATTPKPSGQMILMSRHDDPVLAAWQYGSGRAVAWTSDAAGLWTSRWLMWQNAAKWWANLVTWTLPSQNSAMNINGQVINDTAQLTVDLPAGTSSNSGNQQQAQAHIIAPDGSQQTVTLQPTAPDRWAGSFPATQVGAYLVQVTWQARNGKTVINKLTAQSGLAVPYSPEYRTQGTDTHFLTELAHADNGTLLGPNDTAKVYTLPLAPVSLSYPLTWILLALAALLLPLDIAARRLASIEFISEAYKWLITRLKPAQTRLATSAGALAETPLGSSLSSIRSRREQRRKRVASSATRTKPSPTSSTLRQEAKKRQTGDKPEPPSKQPASKQSETKQPAQSTTEALLAAKRKRRDKE